MVPVADLDLAAGCHDAIEGGQQQIAGSGDPLAALGQLVGDDHLQVQALNDGQQGGDGAELVDDDVGGAGALGCSARNVFHLDSTAYQQDVASVRRLFLFDFHQGATDFQPAP